MIRMQKLCTKPSMDSTWPCAWLASAAGQVPNIISNYYYLSNNNSDDNDIQKSVFIFPQATKDTSSGAGSLPSLGLGRSKIWKPPRRSLTSCRISTHLRLLPERNACPADPSVPVWVQGSRGHISLLPLCPVSSPQPSL